MFRAPSRSFPLNRGELESENFLERAKHIVGPQTPFDRIEEDYQDEEKAHQYFLDTVSEEDKTEMKRNFS